MYGPVPLPTQAPLAFSLNISYTALLCAFVAVVTIVIKPSTFLTPLPSYPPGWEHGQPFNNHFLSLYFLHPASTFGLSPLPVPSTEHLPSPVFCFPVDCFSSSVGPSLLAGIWPSAHICGISHSGCPDLDSIISPFCQVTLRPLMLQNFSTSFLLLS